MSELECPQVIAGHMPWILGALGVLIGQGIFK